MPWPFTRKKSQATEPTYPKRPRNYGTSPWLNTPFAPPQEAQTPPVNIPPRKPPQRSAQQREQELHPNYVDLNRLTAVSGDSEDLVHLPPQSWMPPPPPLHFYGSNTVPPNQLFSDPRFFPQNWGRYHQYPYLYPYPQPVPGHAWAPQPQSYQFSQPYTKAKPRRHTASSTHVPRPSNGQPTGQTAPPASHGYTTLNRHSSAPLAGGSTAYRREASRSPVDESPRTQITRQNTLQNRHINYTEEVPHPSHSGDKRTVARNTSRPGRSRVPATEISHPSTSGHQFFLDVLTLRSGECLIQYHIAFSPDTARRLLGDPNKIADDIAATMYTDLSMSLKGPQWREGALLLPSRKVDWSRQIVEPPVKHVALKFATRQNPDPLLPVANHYGLITVSARNGKAVTAEDLFRTMREFFNMPISEEAFAAVPEAYKHEAEVNHNYRKVTTRFWPSADDTWRVRDDDPRVGGPRIMDFFGHNHKFGGLSVAEDAFEASEKPVFTLILNAWDYGLDEDDSTDE